MAALTVILSPSGLMGGVLDVLSDLAGARLLKEFLWIDAGTMADSQIRALHVSGGGATGTTLQSVLMAGEYDLARVAVLVPLMATEPAVPIAAQQRLAELIAASSGGAVVSRIRCLISRPGAHHPTTQIAADGWHNILLAPEESQGPGFGHALLSPSTDPVDIGRHAAPAIAGLLGLWVGGENGALDDIRPAPGENVQVMRAFHRRLSAGAVETELRRRVTSTLAGTPLPRAQGTTAVFVEDVDLATNTMARALWRKHAAALVGPRKKALVEPLKRIGLLAALKALLSFLGAALRNAPVQWYRGMLARVGETSATAVQALVYGSAGSAYKVVVGGTRPDGTPASWQDMSTASSTLDEVLADAAQEELHESDANFSGVWQDYAAASLTLVDAGQRVPTLPPVQVGSSVGVLRNVEACVPPRANGFDRIPGHLASTVDLTSVAAADHRSIEQLRLGLEQCSGDPALALDAGRALSELAIWSGKHQSSFAVQVGTMLGRRMQTTTQEIQDFLARIRAAAEPDEVDSSTRAQQERLARRMQAFLALLLVAFAGVGALTYLGKIEVKWGSGLAAAALFVWMAGTALTFFRSQRELFRQLARRRQLGYEVEAAQANLRQALKDLKRQSHAYGQFLSWTDVLGAFLQAPFGPPRAQPTEVERIGSGLPRNVGVGDVVPVESALADSAAAIRRDVFTPRWLEEPWQLLISSAPQRLGAQGAEVLDTPGGLFGQPGVGSDSLLVRWAGLVVEGGAEPSGGDALWREILARTNGSQTELSVGLLSSVSQQGGQQGFRNGADSTSVISRESFMARIDDIAGLPPVQHFDGMHFTTTARTEGNSRVISNHGRLSRDGLSEIASLIQLGLPLPADSFAVSVADGTDDVDSSLPGKIPDHIGTF